ncbi:hypothetical protein KIN20_017236 [Parelaphostrongylus tenuis]|uniref:Uncharacterized protein n=1 Tax=Parelaphostrongylus tenuis TaxID=148309 RepID=A0AAD5QRC8_PARTN|nr:hypothetical protein KIN20_017236 [Parelaphostrongylus tenuis]
MGEVKTEAPFLEQLLHEVTPSMDFADGLIGIAENINMEEVINALHQANSNSLTMLGKDRMKRQRRGNRMKFTITVIYSLTTKTPHVGSAASGDVNGKMSVRHGYILIH